MERTITRSQLASVMDDVRRAALSADAGLPRSFPETDRFELAAVMLGALDRLGITVVDDEARGEVVRP